ncbi:uncharacterized protein LOC106660603 isoform X2 [Trichogramma pretiosum]|uniref:uncharacterized protein LOC106660603 isoform X2 n=1 Tax=Trichogramma pretiosum TaxID=7493 RepID=UPI0006C94CEB|nr:uncharacterized protein LOC106660603 isoform X2 [Trichogramma pretiosum]
MTTTITPITRRIAICNRCSLLLLPLLVLLLGSLVVVASAQPHYVSLEDRAKSISSSSSGAGEAGGGGNKNAHENREQLPVFEQTASNVTAFEGQTVYLPCRVHNLADRYQVSWMRSRDLHILSFASVMYISDRRFKLQHLNGSDAWTLQLDRVRKSDAGRYECQVNSEPKIMYAVQLAVKDPNNPDEGEPQSQQSRISFESTAPVAAILGPRELRLAAGSTISFKCIVTSPYLTRPIKAVQWLKDNRLLTFQSERGGINVETVANTAQTLSEATLANLGKQDSGKYTCRPNEGKADSVLLYVQDGELTEAMLRDAAGYSASASSVSISARFLATAAAVLAALLGF